MQHFTLTYSDGRPPESLAVPTSWAEVATAQFLHLFTGTDTQTPTLCVLTGLTPETLGRVAAADAVYLAHATAFAADLSELQGLPPTPGLPDVGQASYGKLLAAQQYIDATQASRPGFGAAAYLLALYTTEGDGSDDAQIDARHQTILAQPITETYADMVFIWGRWQACTRATPATPMTTSKPKTTKTRRVFTRWGSASAPS